jgi:hypothetical protein
VQASRLEGIVTDSSTGALLNNVNVEILTTEAAEYTNLSGEYKTGITEGGNYSVRFSKAGYTTKVFNNVSLTNGLVTTLDAAMLPSAIISLSGTVVDSATNAPIANVQLTLNDPLAGSYSVTSDASGNFTISSFMTGYYDVIAGIWGYQERLSNSYVTTSTTNITVKLPAGYYDDFYFDLGWTTSGTATTGMWERGEPVGTNLGINFINPEYDLENDLGDECYVTGNDGGNPSQDDVDFGYTSLTSPFFDATMYLHPKVGFYYYLGCTANTNSEDSLVVFLSNGTQTVQVASFTTLNSTTDQWIYHEVNVEDFITPADLVASFYIVDHAPENVLEGGIDQFRVFGDPVTTSAQELKATSLLQVFPNPFTGGSLLYYDVSNLNAKEVSIQVMNSIGQVIAEYPHFLHQEHCVGEMKFRTAFISSNSLLTERRCRHRRQ